MRKFMVTVNGNSYEVDVEEVQAGAAAPVVPVAPVAAPVAAAPKAAPKAAAPKAVAGGIKVTSPMPGNILDIKVSVGQSVKKGDVLVILEAMKMENEIMASQDAKVAQVVVQKGATVNSGDVMLVLE